MMKLRGKGQLGVSVIRMCVLILSVASTILALNQNDIYKMVGDSGGLGLVSILVPTLYAIYAKKPSAGGAVGSIFMGAFIWISKDYSYLFYKPYYDLPVSSWILGSFASVGGYYLGRYTEQRLERRRKKACR